MVEDAKASRRHAEIRPDADGFVLVDLASTNGTSVNGRLITTRRLVAGDDIALGQTHIRFEQG
ncbi:MAG: FHA domain-containing protein [Microthrixaceae bacterium]